MIDLAIAFGVVVEALDGAKVRYVVVGSTAAATWGVLRATRDIDIVTVVDSDHADAVIERLLRDDVYLPADDARHAVDHGGTFNILHPASGGKVDVFVRRPDDRFAQSRLARRVRAQVLGIDTWVATPEDVVLAKLRWRVESRSEVQWRDCVEIAATQPLDHDYMWSWATSLGVADDLGELLDQN